MILLHTRHPLVNVELLPSLFFLTLPYYAMATQDFREGVSVLHSEAKRVIMSDLLSDRFLQVSRALQTQHHFQKYNCPEVLSHEISRSSWHGCLTENFERAY